MTVETRYFRSDTHTINGLLANKLLTSLSANWSVVGQSTSTPRIGIRVWKRNSAGTETEITAGSPVAVVIPYTDWLTEVSATWNCPQTSLNSTDAIVVRVYMVSVAVWVLKKEFITEQLGATQLDAATWTVTYWCIWDSTDSVCYFYFDTASYDSCIDNFSYTPPKKPTSKIDLGPHPRSRLLFARNLYLSGFLVPPLPPLWDTWDYLWVAIL